MRGRKKIRHGIVDCLKEKTAAGEKVNVRIHEFPMQFPYIEVETPLETCDLGAHSPTSYERNLSIFVDAYLQGGRDEITDKTDDLTQEIFEAIAHLNGTQKLPSQIEPVKTEIDVTNAPDKSLAFARMEFRTTYHDLARKDLRKEARNEY